MADTRLPIVVLTRDTSSGRAVTNALRAAFDDVSAIVERPVPASTTVRRRALRLGPTTVLGQILFLWFVVPVLRRQGRPRIDEVIRSGGLIIDAFRTPVVRVASVNDPATVRLLRSARPAVIVVSGTRILTADVLDTLSVPVINIHAGLTPAYRGGHGAYWALVDGRPDLIGTTVHLIDAGIDTGTVLEQVRFAVGPADSFATYPWLHLVAGVPALVRVVRQALAGDISPMADPPRLPSRMRTHPTLWAYLWARRQLGVR